MWNIAEWGIMPLMATLSVACNVLLFIQGGTFSKITQKGGAFILILTIAIIVDAILWVIIFSLLMGLSPILASVLSKSNNAYTLILVTIMGVMAVISGVIPATLGRFTISRFSRSNRAE